MMITEEHIQEFISQAHRCGDARLTICSSGNLSWRIGEQALISGTGSWVPSLRRENVAICNIADGQSLNGVKPSMSFGYPSRASGCECGFAFPVRVCYGDSLYEEPTDKLQCNGRNSLPCRNGNSCSALLSSGFERTCCRSGRGDARP